MPLPHLADVVVERVEQTAAGLQIWARAKALRAACAGCGGIARRVHRRYQRRLADDAVAGRSVEIRLKVRRFFCDAPECPTRSVLRLIRTLPDPPATGVTVLGVDDILAACPHLHALAGHVAAFGSPLCQDIVGSGVLGWVSAGPGSDFSEEPAWGWELVTLESVVVPRCPPGPAAVAAAASLLMHR